MMWELGHYSKVEGAYLMGVGAYLKGVGAYLKVVGRIAIRPNNGTTTNRFDFLKSDFNDPIPGI